MLASVRRTFITDHVLARHEPAVALLLVLEQKAERADLAVARRDVQRGFAVAVADVHVDAARDLCHKQMDGNDAQRTMMRDG